MTTILTFLNGRKTYLVMAVYATTAVVAYFNGDIDAASMMFKLLEASGLSTLRAGVKKAEWKTWP